MKSILSLVRKVLQPLADSPVGTAVRKVGSPNVLPYVTVILGFVIVQSLLATGGISATLSGQLIPICAYIVMAVSLNLTVGVLGELSLGHAGFMSVGAFSGVVACMSLDTAIASEPLRLVVGMVIGAVLAGVAGFLIGIPVLRLRGDYLAIVTLAFGEIIKNIINCLAIGQDSDGLHFGFLVAASQLGIEPDGRVLVDGPMGMVNIPHLSSFIAGFVLILVTLFIVLNLVNSRSGRAIMALRDNRIAAESVGIPVTKYKLMAFVTSAALAGAAGTLYALSFSTIVATKFGFNTSILVLVYVVLGGLGNMTGSIIAAALLTVLPELLRNFNDYRMLVYAIVLVLVMLATNNDTLKAIPRRIRARFSAQTAEVNADA
ncbi:MAG: branched-chain amino acid ABC transporter permease [Propionibacteriaceae bacterium]|jgi:branched-chain amino acid transport system permease protein|nr:branched-chain amino acid ABC transporter permease [Propionibacteriaceae bacterium]